VTAECDQRRQLSVVTIPVLEAEAAVTYLGGKFPGIGL
jgi:hypothetical protein